MIGALVPTAVVLGITVAVAAASACDSEWDVDNVSVPVVTAAGDVITLPSLFLATYLVRDIPDIIPAILAVLCVVGGLATLIIPLRSHLPLLRRIVGESLPFLVVAGAVSTLAGKIQSRLGSLTGAGPPHRDPAAALLVGVAGGDPLGRVATSCTWVSSTRPGSRSARSRRIWCSCS